MQINKKIKKITDEISGQKSRFFDALLKTSSNGILITDCRQKILEVNDLFCSFFDNPRQEIVKTDLPTLFERVDIGEPQRWQNFLKNVILKGTVRDTEFTIKTPGRTRYVAVNASLIKSFDETNKDIIISTWRDVSESKRTEEKLRESDIRFRTIVDQSPLSITVYLPEGRPLLLNQAAADLWGYSTQDLEYFFSNYNIFNDLYLQAKGIIPYIKRAFAGESLEIPPVEYDLQKSKASTSSGKGKLWIRSYLYPVRDADGDVGLVVIMHEDITERKGFEDLTRQQLRLAQELNTAADINEALSICVRAAIVVSGMDSGGIYIVDKVSADLHLVVQQGLSADFIAAASIFPADSVNTRLVMKGKALYREYKHLFQETKDPVREKEGLTFIAIVPVLYEGKVIACLNIASHSVTKIPVSERNALETLALQIGGVIARLQAEDALRESEERYRTLQMNIPLGIFRTTPRGKIISANPAMSRMFGYDSEEKFLNLPAVEYYFDPGKREELIQILKEKEVLTGFEVQLKRKDGSTFWGSFNVKGVTDKKGNTVSHDGILEDISERKKWAEAILRARETWERTFDSVPELIMIIDKKYTILQANKAAADRFGISKEKLAGMSCYKVFHNTDNPPYFCPHAHMLKDGVEHSVEIHEENLDCDLLITVSPLYDSDNKLIGAVHAALDITEHKKVDIELQKAEKLESLGLLAGGIAHDFNNILTSILVSISLSRIYVKKESKAVMRLNEAEKAISRAKDLTQQLLTFSRGGAPIRNKASIEGLLQDTTEFVLSGANVRCNFNIDKNLSEVEVDEGQISQVIQNLVLNAVQAMPGGGTLYIGAKNISAAAADGLPLTQGKYVEITVKDQGMGIPRDFLNKIFDPFFTTKQKGSGLGLSTAYSIIKNHNGVITVESEMGKGSTFNIYLPASEKRVKKNKPEQHFPATGQGKVLLMDDEEIILDATSDILGEIGYRVDVAKDGEEAIKKYCAARDSGEPFDIIIMDLIVAGGMGGVETIGEIKKIDPAVKAIVSSGYSTDPVMANFKEYGFKGAVSKPYKIEDMNALLQKVMGKKIKEKKSGL